MFYGYYPNLYWLQSIYFLFGAMVLASGIAWMTASINVFMKDASQIVGILIQFGFWLTPIIWPVKSVNVATPSSKLSPLTKEISKSLVS